MALDACKTFLEPIGYLIIFYPGPSAFPLMNLTSPAYLFLLVQQRLLEELRGRVLAALASAGGYVPTPTEAL